MVVEGADATSLRTVRSPSHQAGGADNADETLRIAGFYERLVTRFGPDPRALDWGSRASQNARFEILAQVGDLSGSSILDVGCGTADLYHFLASRDVRVDYTGYDISPAMVATARQGLPDANLRIVDILADDLGQPQFDYVLASGLFSLRHVRPYDYVAAAAHRMYALCRRGVAMNSLSARSGADTTIQDGRFLADPERVLDICLDVAQNVILRHDYLPHDFTVYLYR